jgi:hypothetical protein
MVTSQLSQITDAAGITTSGGTITRIDDEEFEETMERKQLEVRYTAKIPYSIVIHCNIIRSVRSTQLPKL